jgi:hypothetical protein
MAELKQVRTREETEGMEAGLPEDPVNIAIATAKADALALTRKTIGALLDAANEDNQSRVLRTVESVAGHQRDLINSLKGRKPRRRKKRIGPSYQAMGEYSIPDEDDDYEDAVGGLVTAAEFRSGDNETFGAQVMRQIIGFFRGPAEGLELKGLIESLRTAKDAGLTEQAEQIEAKIKTLLGPAAADLDLDDSLLKPPDAPPSVESYLAQVGYQAGDLIQTLTARAGLPRDAIGRVEAVNTVIGRAVLDIDFGGVVGQRTMDASRVSLHLGGPDTKLYSEARVGYAAGDLVKMPAWDLMDDGVGNSQAQPDSPHTAVGRVHEVKEDDGTTHLVIDFGGDLGRFEVPDVRVSLFLGVPDTKLYGELLLEEGDAGEISNDELRRRCAPPQVAGDDAGELATDEPLLCAAGCGRVLSVSYVESGEDTCPVCIEAQAELEADEVINSIPALCMNDCGRPLPAGYLDAGQLVCPECKAAQAEVENEEAMDQEAIERR